MTDETAILLAIVVGLVGGFGYGGVEMAFVGAFALPTVVLGIFNIVRPY